MGRHRAAGDIRSTSEGPAQKFDMHKFELLGWGLFVATIGAAAMSFIAVPAATVFLVAAVSLAAFVLLWVFIQLHAATEQDLRPVTQPANAAPVQAPVGASAQLPVRPHGRHPAGRRSAGLHGGAQLRGDSRRRAPSHRSLEIAARRDSLTQPAATDHHRRSVPSHPGTPSRRLPGTSNRPEPAAAARAYESSPAASSWTKAFGAPDTGGIPIQPYVETTKRNSSDVLPAGGIQQMSHSTF